MSIKLNLFRKKKSAFEFDFAKVPDVDDHTVQAFFNTTHTQSRKMPLLIARHVFEQLEDQLSGQKPLDAMELAEIEPDSIPISILMPIPETPFENYHDKIDEENVLRTLAVFKIANPQAILRFCGGRMRLSEKNQELALKTCVEGILIGNYLTTVGKAPEQDLATVEKLGKNLI